MMEEQRMKKNNAGITLVSLVITIIVLIILASISVYSGISTIRSAKLTKFTTELKVMQQKVNELYDSYANNKTVMVNGIEYVGKGQVATETELEKRGIQEIGKMPESIFDAGKLDEIFSSEGSGITDKTGYRYYDIETIQALGLENMEYEFFVNVEKRSIISVQGFKEDGKIYYTLNQVPNGVYNVEYNKIDGNLSFEITSEVKNGQGKIHIMNIRYDQYVNKWQVRYRLKVDGGEEENSWYTTEEFTGNEFIIDVPIENLLKDYEIQVIHGDEIVSEVKVAHVLQVGDYINYDPTNGGAITTTYTSPQGTYHSDQAAAIADTNQNMTEGNGYANQTFSVSANTNGWRVLGIDKNTDEILLISADIVQTIDNSNFYLRGQTGYEWGIKELNDICEIYGKGNGASGARSVDADDINNITGYNPKTAQCYDGEIHEYGNEVTYIKNASNISYQDTLNNKSGTYGNSSTIFRYYDKQNDIWKSLTTGESKQLESTIYYYYPNTLTTSESGEEVGILTDSVEHEMLFSRTSDGQDYWLASLCTYTGSGSVYFGLRNVYIGNVGNDNYLFNSYGGTYSTNYGVRPVVSLKSNINIIRKAGTAEEPHEIQ